MPLKVRHAGPGRHADMHGLYLLVRDTGTRSWLLRIQHRGQRRDFGLGSASQVSLADARLAVAEYRRMIRNGLDPVNELGLRRKAAPNFEKVARDCYDAMKGGWKNGKHPSWMSSLENHVFPAIGKTPVDAIDSAAVLRVLEPIWLTIPDTARRILQRIGDGRYAVLQHYAPVEALYEAPMYWMFADKAYRDTASANRGDFTEAMTHQRLVDVFGEENVYRGLNLDRAKGDRIGEIDILVEFAGRVLLVQAKSKRLTIAARQGNERKLRADFKAAVQDAYNQALLCAEALLDPAIQISRADGAKVTLKYPPQAIYPICLVSDHYPSLVAQTDRFLTKRALAQVAQPIVTDIFALDALCEFLDRPLRFIGYCELRDRFSERLIYSHELVLLACHVRQNLWIDDKFGGMMLEDNITGPIEIAMLARRRGIPGERTPRGPLTAFADTPFEGMLRRIEAQADPPLVDLALFMLQANGNSIKAYNDGVELIVAQACKDMRKHDFSLAMGREGLTVHTSYDAPREVRESLEIHVEARKYACRADRWFGLFVDPADGLPQFGLILEFPWEEDLLRAELAGHLSDESPRIALPASLDGLVRARPRRRLGRNDRCLCGSGLKYKKCCGQ